MTHSPPFRSGHGAGVRVSGSAPAPAQGCRSAAASAAAHLRASVLALLLPALVAGAVAAQDVGTGTGTGTVSGRVIDSADLRPVADVEVAVAGVARTVTDAAGFFSIVGVPIGERALMLSHLAYGEHVREVLIERDGNLQLDVRISLQALMLSPLVVEALSDLERRRVTQGTAMREVVRPDIDSAAREGRNLAELLQDRLPGAMIRAGRFGGVCIEIRGARRGRGPCREVGVLLDGVPIGNPGLLYTTIPLNDLERVELLSAAEAGARYGSAGAYGMLLIETRRGPAPDRPTRNGDLLTGFDWSGEAEPYPWVRVFGSSLVGNAAGLALGLALADRCLKVSDIGSFGLRTRCDGLTTVSVGFLSLGLPALAGGLAARWGGATDRSRGRITPAGLAASFGLTAGYLMLIHGEPGTEAAGTVILTLGVPALLTLSDRVFRALR
jgi:hypothetical protein